MPMIDFSVVVLPAPLRPRSVTTSPANTSKVTPCRTWDSPYQAWRSSTARSGSAMASIARSQVGFDHLGIPRHAGVVALGDDLAAGEHRDGVGQVFHHAQVVLDHQDGAVGRHL